MNKKIRMLHVRLISVLIGMAVIMYLLVPLLAGYPPRAEEAKFQKEVLGLFTHKNQYMSFNLLAIIGYLFALNYIFKNTINFLKTKDSKNISKQQIYKVRKEFYKLQTNLLVFYIVIAVSVILSVYVLVDMSLGLKIKFAIIYFLLSAFAWVISITMIRRDMIKVLEDTYQISPEYEFLGRNKKFYENVLSSIIPIFLTIFGIVIMFMYSQTINLKGDKIFEYYKTQFKDKDYNGLTLESIEEKLKLTDKHTESDFYFIVDAKNQNKIVEKNYDSNEITDFFVIYANNFVEDKLGRTYENFGVESEAFITQVELKDGSEVWIGFKYNKADYPILLTFVLLTLITIAIYILITTIWANNMSYTLRAISTNLSNIASKNDIEQDITLPIYSYDEIGELAHSYNEIQRINNEHIEEIRNNQKTILEHERLASLGQMIGGIAHNLKTPIFSIAGAAEGIKYLAEEMEESLTTPTVTLEDKKEIIEEQEEWVEKIKVHLEYMNDIITAVKGQATTFTTEREERFTIKDLFKNVEMLTAHEFKNALVDLEIINNVPNNKRIKGDFNSLLQIINNIVVNAIQAYDGMPNGKVQLIANIGDLSENLVISIRDEGKGMSKEVQDKLFKQMVTTKGKYGTGLGLYMSYSTIKGKFQGEITFESEEGKGSTFHVILPAMEKSEEVSKDTIYVSEHSNIGGKIEIEQTESLRSNIYNKNEVDEKKIKAQEKDLDSQGKKEQIKSKNKKEIKDKTRMSKKKKNTSDKK